MNIRFSFLSICLLVFVTACSSGQAPESSVASSADTQGALSPEEAHKLAKERVEPAKMKQKNEYVKTVKQVEAEREEKAREAIRQVELARSKAEAYKAGQEEESQRVAVLEDGVEAVKTQFKGIKDMFDGVKITPAEDSSVQRTGETPRVAEAPKVEPSAQNVSTSITSSTVERVRTGEYADKTRLVMDLLVKSKGGAAEFRYEMDAANNLLIIRLPNSAWGTAPEKLFSGSKVLKAYAAKPAQNGGTIVAVKLNGPSKVLASEVLGKNDAGYHRVFIDLAKL